MSRLAPYDTSRICFGKWTEDLAHQAFELYGDPEVTRYLGDGVPDASWKDTREKIRQRQQQVVSWMPGLGRWPLLLPGDQQLVGNLILQPLPDGNGKRTDDIEIGWHLARKFWGQGLALEAAQEGLRYALEDLKLAEVWAVVQPENQRSIRLARRLGMRSLGISQAYYGKALELFKIERVAA